MYIKWRIWVCIPVDSDVFEVIRKLMNMNCEVCQALLWHKKKKNHLKTKTLKIVKTLYLTHQPFCFIALPQFLLARQLVMSFPSTLIVGLYGLIKHHIVFPTVTICEHSACLWNILFCFIRQVGTGCFGLCLVNTRYLVQSQAVPRRFFSPEAK